MPIHKKGSIHDPNNYRGITVSSALGKLFNTILNNRLTQFLNENGAMCENQIGFKKKCRTSDHMFVLKNIMDLYKKNKKELYICFVDFAKCFDTIWHAGLFYKLKSLGTASRFYNVIRNMYNNISLHVRIDSLLTPAFRSLVGVRQGDNLSPTLFNIFVNDLPKHLENCSPAKFHDLQIHCLMYADDLIILSDNKEGIHNALDKLFIYCKTWKLSINTEKTKIMYINNPDKTSKFYYDNVQLKTVNEYCYLGIIFTDKCTFNSAIENLYNKGLKALFKPMHVLKPLPSAKTMFHLFDHLIKPIILYSCEIWGPCKLKLNYDYRDISSNNFWKELQTKFPIESKMSNTSNLYEKIHIRLCRTILGVNNKTSNIGIYGELGRYPMYIDIIKQCKRYYEHLESNTENVLLQKVYKTMKTNNNQQSINIFNFNNILSSLSDLNSERDITLKFRARYREFWKSQVMTPLSKNGIGQNKLRTLSKFKTTFKTEPYLIIQTIHKFQKIIARFRLSAHRLKIETGRYNSKNEYLLPEQRICQNCQLNKVEDEIHFLVECPKYNSERSQLFLSASMESRHFDNLNNSNKFIWIMSNEGENIFKNLGIYLESALKKQIQNTP